MESAGKFEKIRALAGGADAAIFGAGASGRAAAELLKVEGLVGVEGGAHGDVVEAVLRAGAGEVQCLVKAAAETF